VRAIARAERREAHRKLDLCALIPLRRAALFRRRACHVSRLLCAVLGSPYAFQWTPKVGGRSRRRCEKTNVGFRVKV
jgi:hypothetical protein